MVSARIQPSVRAGPQGSPICGRRGADRRRADHPAKRHDHHDGDQQRADRAAGDRDIERGDGVRGGLDQSADRRDDDHDDEGAEQNPRHAIAERRQAPRLEIGRKHASRQRIGDDEEAQPVEQRVGHALDPRVGNVQHVHQQDERAQHEQRQYGEHQRRPRRRQGSPQAAGRGDVGVSPDHALRDPSNRREQRDREGRDRDHDGDLPGGQARNDARPPAADQPAGRARVVGRFAPDAEPEARIEDARRRGEGLAGEQFAPRRGDARRVVVDLQLERPRGAQVGVELVVLLLFGRVIRARRVARARVLLRRRRQLGKAPGGGVEARREIADIGLQGDAERVVGGAQPLEIGVAEVGVLQRRVDAVEGRPGERKILADQIVLGARGERRHRQREGERDPEEQAGNGQEGHRS